MQLLDPAKHGKFIGLGMETVVGNGEQAQAIITWEILTCKSIIKFADLGLKIL